MSLPASALNAPAPNALNATLAAAKRRIRMLLALHYASLSLCVTSIAGLVVVVLSKLRLFASPSPWLLAGIIGLGLIVALVVALTRRLPDWDVARATEKRADLKERLSSAVEFQTRAHGDDREFYDAQRQDADRHAANVNVKALYPARFPRILLVGLLTTLILFAFYFVPALTHKTTAREIQEMAEVKKQGAAIIKLAEDNKKAAEQQKLDETKKAATEAQKLGEAMKKGELTKKQSLVEMQKLTRKMEEAQKRLAMNQPAKPMEQAQAELKRSMNQMEKDVQAAQQKKAQEAPQQASQNAKDKQNSAQNPQTQTKPKESDAMKQAKKALEQMQQAMQQQDKQQMQSAMEKMAQQMQSNQMSQEEMQQMSQMMQQMSQALQNTDQNQASQMLQKMAQQMQQNGGKMDPKTAQQMAQMMNQIAQQMGKGDPSKAQMDMQALQQMAQDLKDGRMTMAMGGKLPGQEQGQGGQHNKGAGKGWNGYGDPTKAMKDPGATKPRLMAEGLSNTKPGIGKTGSAKEFSKYLSQANKPGAHLPNAKIAGERLQNGQELQQNMTGDPEAAKSNAPYYQAYQTNRRAAENALTKENIPAAYKKQVRDYFDSIKP